MKAFLGGLLLVGLGLCAAERVEYPPIPDIAKDEQGKQYVQTLTGERWHVHLAQETERPYFYHRPTGNTTWEDPRLRLLTEEEKASLTPKQKSKAAKLEQLAQEKVPLAVKAGTITGGYTWTAIAAIVPVILFAAAMVGRILYLHKFNPDMLFPSQERKKRYVNTQKGKNKKTHGKMAQAS